VSVEGCIYSHWNLNIRLFIISFEATNSIVLKFGSTDNLMSVNILICYSFGDELGGTESTYITLKPYDFSWKNGRFQSISLQQRYVQGTSLFSN
jgi:hypothetical protein